MTGVWSVLSTTGESNQSNECHHSLLLQVSRITVIVVLLCFAIGRCEAFSTYPRSYDWLHADHLFSHYKNNEADCLLEDIMLEMDRVIRPQVKNMEKINKNKSIINHIFKSQKLLMDKLPF